MSTAAVTASGPLESEISKLEIQLSDRRNQRDLLYNGMRLVSDLRDGFNSGNGGGLSTTRGCQGKESNNCQKDDKTRENAKFIMILLVSQGSH